MIPISPSFEINFWIINWGHIDFKLRLFDPSFGFIVFTIDRVKDHLEISYFWGYLDFWHGFCLLPQRIRRCFGGMIQYRWLCFQFGWGFDYSSHLRWRKREKMEEESEKK